MNSGFICMIAYTGYAGDARVRREAETLAASGYHVVCLTNRHGPECRRFQLNGVEVWELDVPKYQGKNAAAYIRSYLHFVAASSAACLRLWLKGQLDVVHVHNLPDFLVLAALIPRLGGVKVILDVHDSVPETFLAKFSSTKLIYKALCLEERLSAAVAHRVICVNHPQRDAIVARGVPASKTFISMNVPNPAIFGSNGCQPSHSETSEPFNLVYHGTMARRLGVDLIIRAVAKLRDRLPAVRLHLWGNGDDAPGFEALAEELRTQDIVLFNRKGFPLEELPDKLRIMEIGVIGNRHTAAGELMLPVKLMEYISLGIPAVVPRLKTIAHYFSNDMVSYYEPEDVDSMADSIYRLCRNAEQRRTQAEAARRFLDEHGWHRQGPELVSFYRELLQS